MKFCTVCGTPLTGMEDVPPMPEPAGSVCPTCGAAVQAGVKFCTVCGTPLTDMADVPPMPEPEPIPEPAGKTCPICGNAVQAGVKFCTVCGTQLTGMDDTPPAPEPGKTICPHCGAVILNSAKFCTFCMAPLDAGAYGIPSDAPAEGERIGGTIKDSVGKEPSAGNYTSQYFHNPGDLEDNFIRRNHE